MLRMRPAVAIARRRIKRGRLKRKRRHHAIKDHDLCPQCWQRVVDQYRARKQKGNFMTGTATRPASPAAGSNGQVQTVNLRRLELKNYKNFDHLEIESGGFILLQGVNGAGKSSVIGAILSLCGLTDASEQPNQIKEGEDRAEITGDFGPFVVTRKFRKKDGKTTTELLAKTRDGQKIADPGSFIKGLLAPFSGDPAAFDQLRPQDRVDKVLEIARVEPPVERVREITGKDHQPKPNESAYSYLERLSADDKGIYYYERREVHGRLTRAQSAHIKMEAELQGLGGPLTGDERLESFTGIQKQIDELQGQTEARRAVQNEAEASERDLATWRRKVAECQADVANQEMAIAELETRLQTARIKLKVTKDKLAEGHVYVAGLAEDTEKAKAVAAAFPDPTPEITRLRGVASEWEARNKALEKRRTTAGHVAALKREAEEADVEHKRLDRVLEDLRYERAHLLDGRDIGVKDVTIGEGELLFQGRSYKSASKGERFVIASAIIFHQKPRLPLMLIDNGEHLDKRNRTEILRQAKANGWGAWIARAEEEGEFTWRVLEVEES